MTRTRKLTLSVREFSHLVSKSLDITSQSFLENTAVVSDAAAQKTRARPPSFQRIFSRPTPTPGQHQDSPHETPEDLPESPRKMAGWPFSRSPRKNRPTQDEEDAIEVNDPAIYHSPYTVTSLAAGSTSSFGSLVPADERLFQLMSGDSDEPSENCDVFTVATSSLAQVSLPGASEPPTVSGHYAATVSLRTISGNGSTTSVPASSDHSIVEPTSNQTRPSLDSTEASHSLAISEPGSFDEDPTPRASSFGSQMGLPPAKFRDDPVLVRRGRPHHLSLLVPLDNPDVLALRPAVGATPHVPSESESSVSAYTSSPTSPVAPSSPPTFPTMGPSSSGTSSPRVIPSTPPKRRISTMFSHAAPPAHVETAPTLGFVPRERKRAMSRSMTPPPSPRPPPTGPLPAVPSSVPPVPPLPPLLNKISMNTTAQQSAIASHPRSTVASGPTNPTTGLPPSPAGGLRLPSRLSWVNGVRAVLPSPPASPTKSLRSLTGNTASPSKAEMKRHIELKRPTSIGVIQAADSAQVRRTKSILLLGSRSKSNASLGTKRVQIHADVNLDTAPARKPRRKSSAATVGHPIFSSECCPAITPMPSAELLVPRERRHSAPLLSSLGRDMPGPSADWTLSLPFCTDVPGNTILPSPSLTPQLKPEFDLEQVHGEDWTLCMPLKVRVGSPTPAAEERDSECTLAESSEAGHTQSTTPTQLPTPSPSPTFSTPSSVVHPLDPEEGISSISIPEKRPASPACLGPHMGGLDLAGGRGKRASGWHVYGWFDEVSVPAGDPGVDVVQSTATAVTISDEKPIKNHVTAFQKAHETSSRHPSQDSTSSVSTSETVFHSARSSLFGAA